MGKPGTLKMCRRKTETRRTETSKYPEEEKTTVIPQVVASERGLAQTDVLRYVGVVGPTKSETSRVEYVWKT